jgi:hypothetical protein
LPYHASGAAKRARLGGTAPARPEAVPATASRGWLAAAAAALAAQGLDVHIGG